MAKATGDGEVATGGSAIGTIVGTIAGAAIANAATAPKQTEEYSYRVERTQPSRPQPQYSSAIENLRIHNIRFIDANRDHTINSGENCKVIFEIINEGNRTAFNVVPVVAEITGMKRIYISPSVMIEQIKPHEGVKLYRQHQCRRTDKDGRSHHTRCRSR